jgi:hypothetical protein
MKQEIFFMRQIVLTVVLCSLVLAPALASADAHPDTSFLPSWKLMNSQEKQHFIAGYVQGWRDAGKVTDITISYVRDNPGEALSGMEKMKSLYDLAGYKPELLVKAIDVFYLEPSNNRASLSSAVNAAKNALKGE